MTYIYLFKAPGMMYAGQHRCPDNRDPMKDWYMGSGKDWCDYLDENGWHKIKEFREHVERIILEVIYEDDREKVGEAEKKWIAYVKEKYPGVICNISKGSKPSWSYDTVEEAEKAIKTYQKTYSQTPKRKAKNKAWNESPEGKAYHKVWYKAWKETPEGKAKKKAWNESPEGKAQKKVYKKSPKGKQNNKVNMWANNHNYPNPLTAIFPPKWSEEDKQEYIRQFTNKYIQETNNNGSKK